MNTRLLSKEFQQFDPYRSPAWRYEEAARLNESRLRDAENSAPDNESRECVKFLRAWNRCTRGNVTDNTVEERKRRLALKFPGLFWAYMVYSRPEGDWIRTEIDARVLAGQTDEEIAQKVSTRPEAIKWYEALWFNVRDRLANQGYISNHIIGPTVGFGLTGSTLDMSAKFFGYFGGPYVLEYILRGSNGTVAKPSKPDDDVAPFFNAHWDAAVRRRSAEAANTFDVNQFNVMQLFDVHERLIAEANRRDEMDGAKTPIEENVSAMLMSIPWCVGKGRKQVLEASPLGEYTGHAAEIRADDMYKIAAGEPVPHLADLSERKLRPPSKKENKTDEDDGQGS